MGSRLSNGEVMRGIFIKHILEDSPAGQNRTLKTGDRIVEVRIHHFVTKKVNKNHKFLFPWQFVPAYVWAGGRSRPQRRQPRGGGGGNPQSRQHRHLPGPEYCQQAEGEPQSQQPVQFALVWRRFAKGATHKNKPQLLIFNLKPAHRQCFNLQTHCTLVGTQSTSKQQFSPGGSKHWMRSRSCFPSAHCFVGHFLLFSKEFQEVIFV